MKKKIATVLMLLVGTSVFGRDNIPEMIVENVVVPQVFKEDKISGEKPAKNAFTYVRMAATPLAGVGPMPGIGVGYRLISGASAADISFSFAGRSDKGSSNATVYTFPKANYLYYFNPTDANSLYLGGGLSWGGIHQRIQHHEDDMRTKVDFDGIIANAAVGYEMQRHSSFRSFVQLDVNQAALSVSQRNAFPSPTAELGVGIGF